MAGDDGLSPSRAKKTDAKEMVAELMYFNAQGQEFKNMVPTTTFYKSSCNNLPITEVNAVASQSNHIV